jgi:hypothetical protein
MFKEKNKKYINNFIFNKLLNQSQVYTSLKRIKHTIKEQMASLINLQERQQMPNQDLKDRKK